MALRFLVVAALVVGLAAAACPVLDFSAEQLALPEGGSTTLEFRGSDYATATFAVTAPMTVSTSTLLGHGNITISANSFTGLARLEVTLTQNTPTGPCTVQSSYRIFVGKTGTAPGVVSSSATSPGVGHAFMPLGIVAPRAVYLKAFNIDQPSCLPGSVLRSQRCLCSSGHADPSGCNVAI
mmetsp:Transcript_35113/g.80079  ORF Transcript_35113/g.80079 Transcript_35113/m.80079 type:complete len:181 (+) Transcript_35113:32-574(+)